MLSRGKYPRLNEGSNVADIDTSSYQKRNLLGTFLGTMKKKLVAKEGAEDDVENERKEIIGSDRTIDKGPG